MSGGAPPLARFAAASLAVLALWAAIWLGLRHPVAPTAVLAGVWLVAMSTVWRPAAWLFWLPALMPVLNFFPWTGWWLVDESDLFLLAVVVGGYGRWAWEGMPPSAIWPRALVWGMVGLAACVAQAVWRGWADAPALPPYADVGDALWQGLYAHHLSAWNSVRVAKSFVWALLLAPLAWCALATHGRAAGQAFVQGLIAGLGLVGLLVVWEREAQVGVLDFVSGYRTAAAFWEMHVGGGAIDAYLALAAPLSLWAAWMAPTRGRWWLALALLWLTIYVLLTTYSRGVMGAFVIALGGWALASRWLHLPHDGQGPGRRRVVAATLVGLLIQGGVVIGTGAFLNDRLEETSKDLLGRWAHWQRGLSLLNEPVSPRAGWWWGVGMGRFTAQYRGLAMEGELPGRVEWRRDADGKGLLALSGPDSRDELAFQFGPMQRVGLAQIEGYQARVRLGGQPGDEVVVSLCRRHLLHTLFCQWGSAVVADDDPTGQRWQTLRLRGYPFPVAPDAQASGRAYAGTLILHATRAGQSSEVRGIQLLDARGRSLLLNGDFADGMAHWMPAAEAHYQPWHIDNLYLDLLLELGLVGWALLLAFTVGAVVSVHRGLRQRDALAWAYGVALLGFLSVGALISVSEIPRVMLLALLTGLIALGLWTKPRTGCL